MAAALMPAGSVWAADYGAAPALLSSGSLDDTVQSAVEEGQKRLGIRISDRAKAEMNEALRTLREWGIAPSAATENIKALIVRQLGWDTPEETETEEEPADTEILFGNEHATVEGSSSEDGGEAAESGAAPNATNATAAEAATGGEDTPGTENAVAGNDSEISAEPAGNSTPAVSEGAENNSNTTILEETTDAIRESLEENSQNFFRQSTEAIRQAIVRFFRDLLTK